MKTQNPAPDKPFVDCYTNIFDALDSVDASQGEVETALTQLFMAARRPVLSLPQAGDSRHILRLADSSADFRKIVAANGLAVSLYGSFTSLHDYIVACLDKPAFIFSSLPCLTNMSEGDQRMTRASLKATLLGETLHPENLPDHALESQEELHIFCAGNKYLSESLMPGKYTYNLTVTTNFQEVLLDELKKAEEAYPKYVGMLVPLWESDFGNRSDYHAPTYSQNLRGTTPPDVIEVLLAIVDYAYNVLLSMRISEYNPHWVLGEKYHVIREALEHTVPDNVDLFDQLFIPDEHAPVNREVLNWLKVRDMLKDMGRYYQEKPETTATEMKGMIEDQHMVNYGGHLERARVDLHMETSTGETLHAKPVPAMQADSFTICSS